MTFVNILLALFTNLSRVHLLTRFLPRWERLRWFRFPSASQVLLFGGTLALIVSS